jgi:hypothetical protein
VSTHRRPARSIALVGVVLGLLLALAGTAAAHGATGTMGIEVTPGAAPLTAKVRILLEYSNDREVATGATVVAEATGPDGATVGPVPLGDQGQGSYEGVLTMPSEGSWTITVTASDPSATASAEFSATRATTTDVPATTTVAPDDVQISTDRAQRAEDGASGDGPDNAFLVLIAVGLAAAVGVTFVLVRRR